jgi:hypothetical protein
MFLLSSTYWVHSASSQLFVFPYQMVCSAGGSFCILALLVDSREVCLWIRTHNWYKTDVVSYDM